MSHGSLSISTITFCLLCLLSSSREQTNLTAGQRLTFWTSDLHDSTRIDMPSLLVHLGHRVIVNGVKGRHGPHHYVLRQFFIPVRRSPVINKHLSHSRYLTEENVRDNFRYYRSDRLMADTDAFLCSFPASFCELWMPFNKSIIVLAAHRISIGRCSSRRLRRLVEHIHAMNASISPRHFIAANNMFDVQYINYYTGLTPILLTSNAFFYANSAQYKPTRREILVGPLRHIKQQEHLFDDLKNAAVRRGHKERWVFASPKKLYGQFTFEQVATHRAVVVLPYAVMSYSITELYAMGIPLFVPSIEMMVQNHWLVDYSILDPAYCGPQMSFPPKHPSSRHPCSPDFREPIAQAYWLQFADYYQWPHITVFRHYNDLIDKLEKSNFFDIHQRMLEANEQRRTDLLEKWQSIISQIQKGRRVPGDYPSALRKLWNTSRLMV
eukprot:GGOE01005634.1.p1 GENE.GGOE01005634.1~~GGOE01005634.1.p1  ORF type:complete len:446 (-),score=107.29 GGOE01005634.1:379-1692(-)